MFYLCLHRIVTLLPCMVLILKYIVSGNACSTVAPVLYESAPSMMTFFVSVPGDLKKICY